MAAEWRDLLLKQVSTLITKGTTPTTLGMSFAPRGINFIKAESVTDDGWIDRSKFAFIDKQTHEALRRSQIEPGDLLLSMAGVYLGKVAVVPSDVVPANTNQALAIIRLNKDTADPKFVAYYLHNREFNAYINSLVGQSAQPNLNLTEIGNLPLRLPPMAVQRAIAHILGTLDDKIELNRRMNETLEAIARALFKSWFVDFDPVRAKAEGRDPGLPKSLADLFPDSFEESELGEIPKGWEVRNLDEIARFLNGLALQKFPPKNGRSLPVIKIAQLRAGNTDGADSASADLDPDFIVEDCDVLFSWSGSLECVLWAGGRGALNQHLFKVTSKNYPKWLCYLWIHQHLADFRRTAAAKATTMGHIQRHHLSEAKVVLPNPELLEAADGIIGPFIESLPMRRIQSRSLAAVRDFLLPELISGRIWVDDVDGIVGP
jgi:type I restriction enzyme S subunit